ncbi:hypothetical protein AAVH_01481 [Aphelenchoides avenae]|nr:hypothetical protein AAVH_01481 [Aphelenchus avenae]
MINVCIFVLGMHVVVAYSHELTDSDYDELVKSVAGQHIVHSEQKTTSRSMPCVEVSDHNATVVKAVGRRNMKIVDVQPASRFHLSFCSTEDAPFCALNSICTTVYSEFLELNC